MLLFRIDHKELVIESVKDPSAQLLKHSVFLQGKRRDRVTDRYYWTDDINEAVNNLKTTVEKQQRDLYTQAAKLNQAAEALDAQLLQQISAARKALQDANDDCFN
ncbi:MAG: E3 ubiquitin ligase [Podoviridae sp. ctLUJ1]|nr:MAG: E3 ubiquitin ligase [Podoviridae sp. ctLUJ1]